MWRMLMVMAAASWLMLSACTSEPPRIGLDEIDFGLADAGSGEKLFHQSHNAAPTCSSCHAVAGEGGGIGNSLAGLAGVASQRVSGQSAEEYLYWSILRPAKHLVAGYANVMYARYEDHFQAEDLADVIAYLLTLD